MIAGWSENTNTSCAAPERGGSTVISAIYANQASRMDQNDNNNDDNNDGVNNNDDNDDHNATFKMKIQCAQHQREAVQL